MIKYLVKMNRPTPKLNKRAAILVGPYKFLPNKGVVMKEESYSRYEYLISNYVTEGYLSVTKIEPLPVSTVVVTDQVLHVVELEVVTEVEVPKEDASFNPDELLKLYTEDSPIEEKAKKSKRKKSE